MTTRYETEQHRAIAHQAAATALADQHEDALALAEEAERIDPFWGGEVGRQEDHADRARRLRGRSQAATLAKYRPSYKNTTASSGHKSKNNGDPIALALAGQTPEATLAAAEELLDLGKGFLVEKYGNLNEGQRRMNSGNRIRNASKKGKITLAQIEQAIAKFAAIAA